MNDIKFQELSRFLQQTNEIAGNLTLRRKAYYEFENLFNYLSTHKWLEENLIEAKEYNEKSVFQNIAEGYFRLGDIEKVFFQYAKLIYELWYEKTIEIQRQSKKRIHKGTQLHQIATIYEFFNKYDKAWNFYLAGFIEDVLEGRDYANHQGYRSLRRFNLPSNNLHLIAKETKKLKGEIINDSLLIVTVFKKEFIIPSYEENESIDYIKLSRARDLWLQLKEKKGEIEKND